MVLKICGFFDSNRFLSNFYFAKVNFNGKVFRSSEHAYQYMKIDAEQDLPEDDEKSWRYQMLHAETAKKSKALSYKIPKRKDWNDVCLETMKSIVLAKFQQNKDLGLKLKATGNMYLEESNTWGDVFWGVCKGEGENNLGKILMEVRDILMSEEK